MLNVSKYEACAPNDPITVATEPVVVTEGQTSVEGSGTASIQFSPTPRLVIEAILASAVALRPEADVVSLGFPGRGLLTSAAVVGVAHALGTEGPALRTKLTLAPEGPLAVGHPARLNQVRFHLINFPRYFAQPVLIEDGKTRTRCDRVELFAQNWRVSLDTLPSIEKRVRTLRRTGGYAVTHSGLVERGEGDFSFTECTRLLEALRAFFSFACGRGTSPVLPEGIDHDGNVVWEEWGIQGVDPWQETPSWFDPNGGTALAEVFPGFLDRWTDPDWRAPVAAAIRWYTAANAPGASPDTSILLACSALEMLTWTQFVLCGGGLSANGFHRLPPADRLRLLLSVAGVPVAIPENLRHLVNAAGRLNWEDGPAALTAMRESILEPPSAKVKAPPLDDCAVLAQWYLELALLRLFRYRRNYANRTRPNRLAGEAEVVPWAD